MARFPAAADKVVCALEEPLTFYCRRFVSDAVPVEHTACIIGPPFLNSCMLCTLSLHFLFAAIQQCCLVLQGVNMATHALMCAY